MTPEDKINRLVESIGAVSEVTRLWYDAFLSRGFTESQALYLAIEILKDQLKQTNEIPE